MSPANKLSGAVDWYGEVPVVVHDVPFQTFNLLLAESHQSCPAIGFDGFVGLEKFSNNCKKFSAISSPYPE